ncbi:MAG: cation diffusion facilitator family transporter, partial [Limnohabitans sp.]
MSKLPAWSPRTLLWASVVVAIITIALKTWAWWITDSVGLLSDALESGVNLGRALVGVILVP